jgi:hypothetical protein
MTRQLTANSVKSLFLLKIICYMKEDAKDSKSLDRVAHQFFKIKILAKNNRAILILKNSLIAIVVIKFSINNKKKEFMIKVNLGNITQIDKNHKK